MSKRLYKSSDKKISGVCGGIAEYFKIDPSIVRIAYAALTLLTSCFPGIILYIVMAFVLPERPSSASDWNDMSSSSKKEEGDSVKFNSYFEKEKEEVRKQKEAENKDQ